MQSSPGLAGESSHSVAVMVACSIHESTAMVAHSSNLGGNVQNYPLSGDCGVFLSIPCHLFHLIWDKNRALIRFN